MSAGTKVFLAVFTLLAGGLVLYYTTVSDEMAPSLELQKPPRPQSPGPAGLGPGAARVLSDALARQENSGSSPLAGDALPSRVPTDDPRPRPAVLTHPTRISMAPSEGDDQAETQPPRPDQAGYTDYFVRPGDTLSSIAARWLGDEQRWGLIARANPQVDADRLRPGDLLRLPPADVELDSARGGAAAAAPRAAADATYTVRSGDTLSSIAKAVYGQETKWRPIYEANRELIGPDPHRLRVGMRLQIPARDL